MGRLAQTLGITKGTPRANFQIIEIPAFGQFFTLRTMKYRNSRAGSLEPSSMRGSTTAKSVAGWRFAPACCAAQSVHRARRRSAVLRFEPVPFPKAIVALPVNEKQAWHKMSAQLNHRGHRNGCTHNTKSTCSGSPLQVRWFSATRTFILPSPVLPNWALNLTLCGGPILGSKSLTQNSPTAKCRLA